MDVSQELALDGFASTYALKFFRLEFMQNLLHSIWLFLKSFGLAALFILNFNELAMASESKSDVFQGIHSAARATLMIVPLGSLFRTRMDETRLPHAACVYEAGRGAPISDLIALLEDKVLDVRIATKPDFEVRIGVFFTDAEGSSIRTFYFNDFGGKHEITGYSGKYNINAMAELSNELRTFVKRHGLHLIEGPQECNLS
jgi:hypothetical protein